MPIQSVLPGRTAPYQVAEIRPQVSGLLQERLFREGTEVEAGQPLYQIDPAPIARPWPAPRPTRPAPRLPCRMPGPPPAATARWSGRTR
ncbi:biotin/lipoyl-binding protein [Pseudoroseomonas wenyumeiae]